MINKKNIEEQKIRRWVRKILVAESNTHLMNERSGETEALYNIFIEPFADVLRVGKMAFKDILTNAKFTFDMLVTFDPWKINDIKNNYKKRKESIVTSGYFALMKKKESIIAIGILCTNTPISILEFSAIGKPSNKAWIERLIKRSNGKLFWFECK